MSYFTLSEFLKDSDVGRPEIGQRDIVQKLSFWMIELTKVRSLVGFPIKITDSVRWGDGDSQHYFKGQGAIDCRPLDKHNQEFFYMLGLALFANPNIKRICYYPKGELFPFGGFHIDAKTPDKQFFISNPNEVLWERSSIDDLGDILFRSLDF